MEIYDKLEIMKVNQLPEISEQMILVSAEIDSKISRVLGMECNEETKVEIKNEKARLKAEWDFYEAKRISIKNEILKPYDAFNELFKKCISDKFSNADLVLKNQIATIEDKQKLEKETEAREYFTEYLASKDVDFLTFANMGLNITLGASLKSLKDKIKATIDKAADDLQLIGTQEHSAEILMEYKRSLNAANAIMTVSNRHKAIEEERQRAEQVKITETQKAAVVEKVDEVIKEPVFTAPEIISEPVLTVNFKITDTRTRLKELKNYLTERGYKYE